MCPLVCSFIWMSLQRPLNPIGNRHTVRFRKVFGLEGLFIQGGVQFGSQAMFGIEWIPIHGESS